jgi:hypothetical protein
MSIPAVPGRPQQRSVQKLVLALLAVAGAALAWSMTGARRPDRASADGNGTRAPAASVPQPSPATPAGVARGEPPAEAAAAAATAARVEPPALLPAGVLRSADGTPHAGAELAWTALLPEFEGREFLREVEAERLQAVTVTTRSGADGRFRFDTAPPELGDGPSVVWVTHERHEAGRVAFDGPGERARWNGALELVPRAPLRVRVTRAGKPVAGARVRHQLSSWGTDPPAYERRLRRAFLRELESGPDGTLEHAPGAGENAVQAFLGEECSLLFSAEPTDELELELLPTIEVRGQVTIAGPAAELDGVRYRVSYFDPADPADAIVAQGSMAVHADGSLGPDRWPRAARERMVVSLFGGELVGVDAERATPEPGGSVFVELATRRGLELDALVRGPDGAPLAEAFAYALRPAGDGWSFTSQGTTDSAGQVRLRGLPPGALWLQFGKGGYTTLDVDDHRAVLPRSEEAPLAVVLAPAGLISGCVTSAGAPVKRFSVFGWTSDRAYDVYFEHQDEEGRFEVENAPLGKPLHLFAYTDELPQSETAVVVPGDAPAEVALTLPAPRHARGRVVDSLTGLPVAKATITHATSGLTGLATPRGRAMPVEADGRFELDGFFPGRGGFSVRAAGYEPLHYSTRVDEAEVIDVGLVPMNPLCTLEVYVREDGVADYSAYRAWNACNDDPTPVPVRADGTLALVTNTGKYLVHLARPDGSVLVEGGVALPGSVEVVEFDLTQGIELTVPVRAPPARIEDARLRVWWRAGQRERRVEAGWSAELAAFRLQGVGPGEAVLQLLDAAGASLGQRSLRLSEKTHQSVTLELGGVRRRLRLVDARGDPWASCAVHVSLEGASGWYATASTDAAGELELGPLEERRVVLSARLGNEGLAYGQVVDLETDPARATVVTLELGGRSLLRLVELGEPRAGVHVAYRHASAPHAVEFGYASDETGLIKGPFCAPGTYELRVNHRDYWPGRPSLRIDGSSVPVVVELYSLGALELTVTEPGGRPIAGARLELAHRELGQRVEEWIAAGLLARPPGGLRSDENGTIVLAGLPRGTYAWRWIAPGGEVAEGEGVLAPRGRKAVEARIVLER